MNEFDDRLRDAGRRVGDGLVDLNGDPARIEARRGRRSRVIFAATTMMFVLLLVGLIAVTATRGDGDKPGEQVAVDIQPIEFSGPYDGLESVGHPVVAEPDVSLIDSQTVSVTGSGFPANVTIAGTQCWLGSAPGSADGCDLGNIVTGATDGEGSFRVDFVVRRHISTANGSYDCATGGLEESCIVGFADVNDYDQSGRGRIFFDPATPGEVPPLLVLEPDSDLTDGDILLVRGSGFQSGETALLTQCVIGGMDGVGACFSNNPTAEILVDQNGSFAVEVPASRRVTANNGSVDCFTNVYGCRLVVQATRMPNPLTLTYRGSERPPPPPEYTLVASENLADGQAVVLTGFDIRGSETVKIEQCVDQGPEGISCVDFGRTDVSDGSFTVDLEVQRWIWNAEGQPVDCAQQGRTCYLDPTGAGLPEVRIPVRFTLDDAQPVIPTLSVDDDQFAFGDTIEFRVDDAPPGAVVRLCGVNAIASAATGRCGLEAGRAEATTGELAAQARFNPPLERFATLPFETIPQLRVAPTQPSRWELQLLPNPHGSTAPVVVEVFLVDSSD